MAYNNYFPSTYQPNFYGGSNGYGNSSALNTYYPQQMQGQTQQSPRPQIQQSGFVLVQSEQEARAYPVAPGNSVTFKDERQPFCYVKTMGFNQLSPPTFERYRLVKEDSVPAAPAVEPVKEAGDRYATKDDLAAIMNALDDLSEKLKAQAAKKPAKVRKVVEVEDEDDE